MRAFWYLTAGIPSALAASTGQFDVLAFNVAGLPAFLNNNDVPGDKKTNSEELGAKFAEYGHDVVQLQEVIGCPTCDLLKRPPSHRAVGLQLPCLHLPDRQSPLSHAYLRRCCHWIGAEHPL